MCDNPEFFDCTPSLVYIFVMHVDVGRIVTNYYLLRKENGGGTVNLPGWDLRVTNNQKLLIFHNPSLGT